MSVARLPAPRPGTTLLELLVLLAVLALITTVASLAARVIQRPSPVDPRSMIADSLRVAARAGRSIAIVTIIDGARAHATVHPDGSVVADSAFGIDRLTGMPTNAR